MNIEEDELMISVVGKGKGIHSLIQSLQCTILELQRGNMSGVRKFDYTVLPTEVSWVTIDNPLTLEQIEKSKISKS